MIVNLEKYKLKNIKKNRRLNKVILLILAKIGKLKTIGNAKWTK